MNFTADYLDYMAEWARRIEGEVITSDRANEQFICRAQAAGRGRGHPALELSFFLIARKMAFPSRFRIFTGNTIVIKAQRGNAHQLPRLHRDCWPSVELPAGVFNVLFLSPGLGAALAGHAGVDMVSFTGSVATGERIADAAAPHITKLNLELGAARPRPSCWPMPTRTGPCAPSATRASSTPARSAAFAERVDVQRHEQTSKPSRPAWPRPWQPPLRLRRSARPDVEMGPLINQKGLDSVQAKVRQAIADGAQLFTGGQAADLGAGFFYFQPTVQWPISIPMEIMRKEILEIPCCPSRWCMLDEAIALANDCEYGLTSSLYTRDLSKAMQAMREIDFGETYMTTEQSKARVTMRACASPL